MTWLALVISLPTENAALRQRIWRALKASGAATLRDGVYLLPDREDCRGILDGLGALVREGGGTARLLGVCSPEQEDFRALFDRSEQYAALLAEVVQAQAALGPDSVSDTLRQARKLRKAFASLSAIDFFPGEPQRQLDAALQALELACARTLSPDEPSALSGEIGTRNPGDYQGRVWATRQRPWVDRLASAWLIRRFIDARARILWLPSPEECPADALGFDFDGATFSHVGNRVTFEVLAASFGLERPALARLGLIVHGLDVGGIQPPEATGVESVLAGLRTTIDDDDLLLDAACAVFDALLASFEKGGLTP